MGRRPKWVRGGATIPALAYFQQQLGLAPTVFAFSLPSSNLHAPDEHVPLTVLDLARRAYVRLLFELGRGGEGGADSEVDAAGRDEL